MICPGSCSHLSLRHLGSFGRLGGQERSAPPREGPPSPRGWSPHCVPRRTWRGHWSLVRLLLQRSPLPVPLVRGQACFFWPRTSDRRTTARACSLRSLLVCMYTYSLHALADRCRPQSSTLQSTHSLPPIQQLFVLCRPAFPKTEDRHTQVTGARRSGPSRLSVSHRHPDGPVVREQTAQQNCKALAPLTPTSPAHRPHTFLLQRPLTETSVMV